MLTQSRIKNGRYIKGEQRILIFGEVCGEAHENLTMVSTTVPGVMFVPKKWICVTHVAPVVRGSASPTAYSPHDARGSKNSEPNTLISIR
jgi:hypothetical protein